MNNCAEKVGEVRFDNRILNVYSSLDEPLFLASEIEGALGYSYNNVYRLTGFCEDTKS